MFKDVYNLEPAVYLEDVEPHDNANAVDGAVILDIHNANAPHIAINVVAKCINQPSTSVFTD
jgi:hypothetical protein|tara:strand:+ start:420 stop:605 length:186 start_codon:yes stop_codon:yes gene_type:complete